MLNKIKDKLALFSALWLLSTTATAHHIIVKDGYVRESIPGTTTTSAYFVIVNNSDIAIALLRASAMVSPQVELHQHEMVNGMMKMGQVEQIVVASGSQVELKPFGLHVMLFNLIKPVKAGETVSLTLTIDDGSEFQVSLPVVGLNKPATHQHNHED